MKRLIWVFILVILYSTFLVPGNLKERIDKISKPEMQGTVEFLSHDLVEGRAPGTRGGDLSEIYVRSIFKFLGLEPGFEGRYLQPFSLKGFTIEELNVNAGGYSLSYGHDVIGSYTRAERQFEMEADVVFVGFGIKSDLWQWDDFKDSDVKNKIVIVRVNDPGMFHPDLFEGKTLTYFGRWTYHMEEAARKGAAGVLLIHTDESAGYGWKVVENSWSGEEVYLESDLDNNLRLRAWIKEDSLRRVLQAHKIDLDKLYERSLRRDFEPVNLGFKAKVWGKNKFRELSNNNVVASLPGKTSRRIVLSAHIDHFGIVEQKKGDNIFNGAIDNGTAVASMLVAAKILKEFQKDLYYSVTFLACNSEEAGMLGSLYYVRHADRNDIVADINFESTPVWEKAGSIMGIGARFSTFEDILKSLAKKEGIQYREFSMSNQGFFYRSDQFSFGRYGIPAIWISAGEDDESGQEKYSRFWKTRYHTVQDEFDPSWPLEGMKQTIRFALMLVDYLNTTRSVPHWKSKLTFPLESKREKQLP